MAFFIKNRMQEKLKVAVLMGGRIIQHEMSVANGIVVINWLNKSTYQIKPVKVTAEGKWLILDGYIPFASPFVTFSNFDELLQQFRSEFILLDTGVALHKLIEDNIDIVFIASQGSYGESGIVQGHMETAGIPYTGSGISACALATDKVKSKHLFHSVGLSTPEYMAFRRKMWYQRKSEILTEISDKVGIPCIAKPVMQNSSIGVSLCENINELITGVETIFNKYEDQVIVEKYLNGTELTCAVMENENSKPIPLLLTEIIPKDKVFSYKAKYVRGMVEEIYSPNINPSLRELAKSAAVKAHTVLGCEGLTRTDMILYNEKLYILELNVVPAMIAEDFFKKAAKTLRTNTTGLLDRIVTMALEKHKSQKKYQDNISCLLAPYKQK